MDRVVYVLGAGFSAPLGLPLMTNFLLKSKDIYFSDPERYKHFGEVFDVIKDMSVSKNYYQTDLFNIEEILSILEMKEQLGGGGIKQSFLQYIADVIEFFTPSLPQRSVDITAFSDGEVFSRDEKQESYGGFIGSLLNLYFEANRTSEYASEISLKRHPNPSASYGVITLNYDMLIERYIDYLNNTYAPVERLSIINDDGDSGGTATLTLPLAKLHGSIDTKLIVPPTWNKALNAGILPAWRLAYKLLVEANHIRIIGYSLPTADSYVKYLFKSAVIQSPHLKSIDVLCLDRDGETEKRYRAFINFYKFRFVNTNVEQYVQSVNSGADHFPDAVKLNRLEQSHEIFFSARESS